MKGLNKFFMPMHIQSLHQKQEFLELDLLGYLENMQGCFQLQKIR